MALVEAYFDESGTHADSPFLCVAGYIFEKDASKRLQEAWGAMLRKYELPYFRMALCAHGNGVFSKLSPDERIAVETEAIELIKTYMAHGFVFSIDVGFEDLIPQSDFHKSAYTFACWQALAGTRAWANKNDFQGDIAYIFEAGQENQSQANGLMQKIFAKPVLRQQYRYCSHSFIDGEKSIPTQCADLLAWQWTTHLKRQLEGKPMRKDFDSLIEREHFATHYDEQKLRELRQCTSGRSR